VRGWTIVALLTISGVLKAEEKSWGLRTADLVVVGKLELSSYYLSFDGVHINGSIVPTEILFGNAQSGVKLRYSNIIPCSALNWILPNRPVGCDYRVIWSEWTFVKKSLTQDGVWILWRTPDKSWTGRGSDPGIRPMDYREYAVSIVSGRTEKTLH